MSTGPSRQITPEEQYQTSDFDKYFEEFSLQSQLNAAQESELIHRVDLSSPSTLHTGDTESHLSYTRDTVSTSAVGSPLKSETPSTPAKRPRNMRPCTNCKGHYRCYQTSSDEPCERCNTKSLQCEVLITPRSARAYLSNLTSKKIVREAKARLAETSQNYSSSTKQVGVPSSSGFATGQDDIHFDNPGPADRPGFVFDEGVKTEPVDDASKVLFNSALCPPPPASMSDGTTQASASCDPGQIPLSQISGGVVKAESCQPATMTYNDPWETYMEFIQFPPESSSPDA